MKIALQLSIIPGNTVEDKQKWALDHGVDGIEISAWDYPPEDLGRARKDWENSPIPVSSICGNATFDLLDPDPKKRQACIDYIKDYLKLAGDLGAVGQIVPPIFGPPRINDLSPWMDAVSLEKELLVHLCGELGDVAEKTNTYFLLEPLNRYEQHLLRTQADAVEIIERCGHPRIRLISDLFHMHIEETDTPAALRAAGKYIKHVHLADNTRLEPGTGDIDFVAAFRALADVGFSGYMAFECGVSGEDKASSLAKSLTFVRSAIAEAQGKCC
ncbi:MAG: sugar phosphate isomerase/epimerase [Firmicutes bacterium]|nr:sugar phosphate isomerase/epimerase [Bacillota bacterium]